MKIAQARCSCPCVVIVALALVVQYCYIFLGEREGSRYESSVLDGRCDGRFVRNKGDDFLRYSDLIGCTPMIDLTSLASPKVPGVRVLGKAEFLNPGFSMKDRMAQRIITMAMETGELPRGGTVVAASSGNTGAAVAMLCAMLGLKAVIITNPKCSKEKQDSIKAYGATLIIAKPGEDYMAMEHQLAKENPGWFAFDQYNNLANPEAHYTTTGPEVWEQSHHKVTHFVMAGSTGGTVSGVGTFLKEMNPEVQVVLADPIGSIFTHYHKTLRETGQGEIRPGQKFLVEGVGKESIPGAMNMSVIDRVIPVSDKDAFQTCRDLATKEGILVGGSAGLNVRAAIDLANSMEKPAVIVTVLCDTGIKYLSKIYNNNWLLENGVSASAHRYA